MRIAGGTLTTALVLALAGASPAGAQFADRPPGSLGWPLLGPEVVHEVVNPARLDGVAIGDITGDGRNEIVATASWSPDRELLVVRQDGRGGWHPIEAHPLGASGVLEFGQWLRLAVADMDGDGVDDIAVAQGGIEILRGTPDGPELWTAIEEGPGAIERLEAADVDGDGRADLIASHIGDHDDVVVHRSTPSGFEELTRFGGHRRGATAADVTGNGEVDLVTRGLRELIVHRQDGGEFVTERHPLQIHATSAIQLADLDGDGRHDLLHDGPSRNQVTVSRWDEGRAVERGFADILSFGSSVVGDLDGDGIDDLVVATEAATKVHILRGHAGRLLPVQFAWMGPAGAISGPDGMAIGDVTGDGRPDLVIGDHWRGLVVLPNVTGDVAPWVAGTTPCNLAPFPRGTRPEVRIRFHRHLDPASLAGNVGITYGSPEGRVITRPVDYDVATRTLSVRNSQDLDHRSIYVHVGPGVTDRDGRPIPAPFVTAYRPMFDGDRPPIAGCRPGPPAVDGPDPTPRFSDIAGSPHERAILAIVTAGYAAGHPDGTFRPNANLTRAQMATLLTNAFELDRHHPRFSDVPGTSPHAGAIGAVDVAGFAEGYPDATFRPNRSLTRGQMATLLANALELTPREPRFRDVGGSPHAGAIGAITAADIATGFADGTFRPNHPLTRGQMATLLANTFGLMT